MFIVHDISWTEGNLNRTVQQGNVKKFDKLVNNEWCTYESKL